MEEATTNEAILWPLQDEDYLTANATTYVDDYLQAVEIERYFDNTLLSPDALYPDLYGATVDWETVLQRKHAPVTRTEQLDSSPSLYINPTEAVANTRSEQFQTSYSSPAALCTDDNVYFANDNLPTTAIVPLPWANMAEQCLTTSDSLIAQSGLINDGPFYPVTNEKEIFVTPKDLILCGRREVVLMQAGQKHGKDVLRRYLRAEHEIASLSRRTHHSNVENTKREVGRETKQSGKKRQKRRGPSTA
ncbi:hypothetical protein J3E72DRAFT_273735 [Bipolaris maydis]|nr:hypothetical protein J3E72DRAFT_273735 [Bipolaris maydis]